ncbi:MAG TPA: amino acid adenylation domain-containing protein, partial [Thermoanaerobaculia bacterium]|nr:amino acid adenylation domain-containing protein [Thermoanaerobaculia bacterium]
RAVALARERGLDTELADLFQHQSVAELGLAVRLVRLVEGDTEGTRSEPLSLLSAEDRRKLPPGIEDAYPLAMLQAGMLFHMGLTPEEPQYHNVDSWHVRGHFEVEAFQEAVRRVVARHPLLRTSFAMTGYSEPLQLVHAAAELPLTVEDIRHLAPAAQEAAIDRLILQEKRRPFDLTRAPQLRFHVFLRSAEAFQFTLGENHAIFDGWSLHATLSEIFELYFALLSGAAPEPLPPLALTYREHVRREREALASLAAEEHWRRLLQGAELVELPSWPPGWCRPGQYRMERLNLPVPPAVTAGLRRLALEVAVPLKSVLLAAHLKVLSLLAGRPDVVSGVVLNGRSEESEGDQVRGLFLNTLPLRLRLPDGSWADLVRAAFQAELELLPHRRYPFAAVQRRWGDRPLFEIIFNYIRFHVVQDLMRSGNVEVLQFKQAEGGHFKLQAHFNQDLAQTSVGLGLEYDSHVVPSALVREIGDLYLRTLESMAGAADGEHGEVSILRTTAGQKLLREWNDTDAELAGARHCLHELIEEQARRTPERVAVAIEGESLTYQQLSRRSNQLARSLRHLGVGPEVRVALCAGRSPEMVVALLGILKAGGAYVPLDPAHPAERLALVLGDSAPEVLVTEERWLERLGNGGRAVLPRVVCLDRDRGRVAAEERAGLEAAPDGGPGSLAYVIYTSGSTGRPKGVCLPHGAVVNFLLAMAQRLGLGGNEVIPALTTLTFDIAGLEVYLPLLLGGRVEVVGTEEAADGRQLVARLAAAGMTAMQATPATWRLLLDAGWSEQPGLAALCGGEALPRPLASDLLERGVELWNVYGPTETAIWSAAGVVAPAGEGAAVGLGRPLANTRFYVVGPGLEPVPAGAAGELLIAGAGVARGYWGRPALTAERFVPDAWSPDGGARLYRTGDLVRHRLDGDLEFLGRADHQIKLRGFRIELGEIEAALLEHPGVSLAAVVPVGEGTDRRLVACFVSPAGQAPAEAELRERLRGLLPAYMVPAAFVLLPEMPLTPSGKIDRRVLTQSAMEVQVSGAPRRAPRAPIEEIVAGLWAEVLGVPRVGLDDDFFQLGGHSLMATRLFSRLRETLHVELPLRTLFEAPRLADLAARVQAALAVGGGVLAPPLERVSRDLPLPLSFAQEGLWFIDRLHPGGTAYNIPLTVRLTGQLDAATLSRTLAEIVRRHETLRTVFAVAGDRPVQVILPEPLAALATVDLAGLPPDQREREAGRLATEQMRWPFDLARGPLLRHELLRLGQESHLLVMGCHHIIADAWSIDVLARELAALYPALHAGRPSPLPELPVQYADFAAWQRGWLQGETLRVLLDHWRQVLAGAPFLELPIDRPRRAGQGFRGGELRATLPAA